MAGRTRTTRTRKTAEQKTAEAQAAADAAADINEQPVEEQAVPETETAQPETTAEATAEAETEPTAEEIATAEAKAEKERFDADVATAEEDLIAASKAMMPLHAKAVQSKADVDNALKTWREKNANSLKTLEKCQVRLAAARTTLRKEWQELVTADQQTTTVENEGETPDTVYHNALAFPFDDGVAANEQGPEKDYWLAAQRYNSTKKDTAAEPEGMETLRKTADEDAQAFNWAEEVYNTALANKIS